MYQLFQKLKHQKVSLSYLGVFNDQLTDTFISLSEFYFENGDDLSKLKNRVSFLIAECFQNVVRHGNTDKKTAAESNQKDFYQITIYDDRVVMTSCNLIANSFKDEIKDKINKVNELNAEQLKKLYTEVLSNQGFSSKGGAGLGLIEMARKSGQNLNFSILPFDEEFSRFFLSIEIMWKKEKAAPKINLDVINELYTQMLSENKVITYKGEFSEEIVIPLTEMMHQNLQADEHTKSKEKKVVVTLIELLQNISIHGKKINNFSEGIFSLSKEGSNFIIEAGNVIEENDFISLSNYLNQINKMELEEIAPLFRKWLDSPEHHSGLGILEIAKNSGKQFTYDFKKLKDGDYFYTIKVIV